MLLVPLSFFPAAVPGSGGMNPPADSRADLSDEFGGTSLDPKWSWYNPPAAYDVGVTTAGNLHMVANRNTNFGGSSDSGVLLYQPASGNFSIETKIASDPGQDFEKAGIMVRGNASNWVALMYQAQNGKQVELTTKVGGVASDNLNAVTASPVWLRLERDGQTFTSYYSTDGSGWTFGWSVSVGLNDSVSIGLLIADGNANADYAADFDYFRVGPPNHAPTITDPFTPVSGNEDEQIGVDISTHLSDPDGDKLAFEVTDAAHIQGAFNDTLNDLEIWGAPNWFGAEFANIKATDRFGASIKAQIRVTVAPVPDAPYLMKPIPDILVPQAGLNGSTNLSKCFFDNDTLFGGSDSLTYSLSGGGPLRVDIGSAGLVTVAAPIDFWGEVNLTFTATDKTELSATGGARVSVYHVNQAPQVKASPPDTVVNEDESVTINLGPVFWDPDGDAMTVEATGNSQMAISLDRLNITFTPVPDASGFTETITLRARDDKGLGGGSVTINVTVISVNDPPRITSFSPPGNVTLMENDDLDFSVAASDVESGTDVTYSWSLDDVPAATGVTGFTFRTNYSSAGDHTVKVVVSDGELTTIRSWNVTVRNLNREPTKVTILNPKPGATCKEGTLIGFDGSASDPDGDPLEYRWLDGISELGLGPNFTFALPIGVHKIALEASDGFAVVRSPVVSITIKANSRPSLVDFTPSGGQSFGMGKAVQFSAEALDADSDTLTYVWTDNGKPLGSAQAFTLGNLSAGKHRIHLSVSDGTAVAETDIDITVNGPSTSGPDVVMVGIVAGIAVAAAILAVFMLVRRQKKPEPIARPMLEQPALKW
jgi:regulation of enolase protein 1 (concanavalin A-like superfamily)